MGNTHILMLRQDGVVTIRGHIRDALAAYPKSTAGEIAWRIASGDPLPVEWIQQLVLVAVEDEIRHNRNRSLDRVFSNRSVKKEAQTAAWRNMLDAIVKTEKGATKIGDCSRADLDYIIADRRTHIERVEKRISQYEKLRDLLELRGVAYVRDLPVDDVEEAMAA